MLRGLALWLCCGTAFAACELPVQEITGRVKVGEYVVERTNAGLIGFAETEGDLTGRFNFDTLYEVQTPDGPARFRLNDDFYVKGQTFLANLHWEQGSQPPSAGRYEFSAAQVAQQKTGKSIAMVGDSITWWSYGRYFRCLLANELSGVSFAGPHADTFGFGHAGEGGNKTGDILARIDSVPTSDFYFVLAGTNDWPLANPAQTFANIRQIAERLDSKGGKVIVSTLLPRLDVNDSLNQEVNALIKAWDGAGCDCSVVDLDESFRALPDQRSLFWDAGIHPNLEGYQRVVSILAPQLSPLVH